MTLDEMIGPSPCNVSSCPYGLTQCCNDQSLWLGWFRDRCINYQRWDAKRELAKQIKEHPPIDADNEVFWDEVWSEYLKNVKEFERGK